MDIKGRNNNLGSIVRKNNVQHVEIRLRRITVVHIHEVFRSLGKTWCDIVFVCKGAPSPRHGNVADSAVNLLAKT